MRWEHIRIPRGLKREAIRRQVSSLFRSRVSVSTIVEARSVVTLSYWLDSGRPARVVFDGTC